MLRTSHAIRVAAIVGIILATILPLAACGAQIETDTACKECMQQAATDRDDAVTRAAAERGNSVGVTPLGTLERRVR